MTLLNLLSIIVKQIALSYLLDNGITVICHGNGVSARTNRNAVRKYPTINKKIISKTERGDEMESASFMKVDEVAQEIGVSKSYAYKIVQKLNAELAE